MQAGHGFVHLPRHVDVLLRGLVAEVGVRAEQHRMMEYDGFTMRPFGLRQWLGRAPAIR